MNQQQQQELFDCQADALGESIGDIRLGDFNWSTQFEVEIRRALKAGWNQWLKNQEAGYASDSDVLTDDFREAANRG